MSFRSLTQDREHNEDNIRTHRKAGKRRSNSAPTISVNKTKDINCLDNKGRSSLFYAAKYGEVEIVRHLLKHGADPDLHDKGLNYPIHEAIDGAHLEVVELLIRNGCAVNCKNISGQTPLMRAVLFDDIDAVKMLVKSGANTDEIECTGKSALLIGLQEGHDKVCKFLIKTGCDVNVIDDLGQSALYFAIHRSTTPSTELCRKLFKYGYNAENDSDWLSKDLYQTFTQYGKGLFSKIMCKIGLLKTKVDFDSCGDILSDDYIDARISRMI